MINKIILTLMAAVYALSPYDILPDFLVGWGWLDDLFILYLLWRYVYSPSRKRPDFRRYFGQKQQSYRRESASADTGGENNRSYTQSQTDIRDPYTVLGISKGASEEEIRKAYTKLANQYHPDKVQHLGEEFRELAEKRFKEIQQAYQQLKKT
ncbi:MAG TPA: DnaJ domain-containing protein [Deltaproteobacteria bacterium]|nr:DnaJ domain-containing protein [Deltaproteobacteria bacterium]